MSGASEMAHRISFKPAAQRQFRRLSRQADQQRNSPSAHHHLESGGPRRSSLSRSLNEQRPGWRGPPMLQWELGSGLRIRLFSPISCSTAGSWGRAYALDSSHQFRAQRRWRKLSHCREMPTPNADATAAEPGTTWPSVLAASGSSAGVATSVVPPFVPAIPLRFRQAVSLRSARQGPASPIRKAAVMRSRVAVRCAHSSLWLAVSLRSART